MISLRLTGALPARLRSSAPKIHPGTPGSDQRSTGTSIFYGQVQSGYRSKQPAATVAADLASRTQPAAELSAPSARFQAEGDTAAEPTARLSTPWTAAEIPSVTRAAMPAPIRNETIRIGPRMITAASNRTQAIGSKRRT